MELMQVTCIGTSPLLMHNARLANPFDPFTIAVKEVTSKRKKTEEDASVIYWNEWCGGLYTDKKFLPSEAEKVMVKPIIPAANILSFLNDGARHFKRGQDVWRGVTICNLHAPLDNTNWPEKKTLKQIYDSGTFSDIRSVVIGAARTMRSRPIFENWSFTFDLQFDPELLNRSDLISFVDRACRYNGICDGKPLFGRCRAEIK